MKNLRIVFMGTPEFAVASLGSLLINGFNVVAVVTAPDKPAGRGRQISKSAVKEFAEYSSLPVLQPSNLKDPGFIEELTALKPDLFIVVAFRMLPAAVWKIPLKGTINLHASLLPNYRGSAPVNHVIINGETSTGLTTFLIDDKIDTGNILLREDVPIFSFENAGDLHDRLMKQGARLIVRTISGFAEGTLEPKPQSDFITKDDLLKTAPKITPEFCNIDWNKNPIEIHNLIRGLAPYPCARMRLNKPGSSILFKVYESTFEMKAHHLQAGTILSDGKSYLKIACNNGFVTICSLQPEGKKRMKSDEFLRGFRIEDYSAV
ncbi:MAG TPA: methionyl-tRNA formyltransferase [Bacteroidales bacterium]|nr:methionyl-tRNA formyltransferase [Bacteroidales bacterium]